MKAKLIPIMLIILLSFTTLVAAYDIDVQDIYPSGSNPPLEGVAGEIYYKIQNTGANDMTWSSGELTLDFGDGTNTTFVIPPLDNGEILEASESHTYATAGTYPVSATFTPLDFGDTTPGNNDHSENLVVDMPVYDFDMPDFSFGIVQGFSQTQTDVITNSGTANAMVYLQANDLTSGSNILSAGDIDIDIAGPTYGGTVFFFSSSPRDIQIEVDVDGSQAAGTYTGTYDIRHNGTGTVIDSASLTVQVVPSGGGYTNTAPVINSIGTITATTGVAFEYDVVATDADNDPLTYTITTGPSGMTINGTGYISGWTPSVAGTESVTVEVSDGIDTDTESFTVDVVDPTGTGALSITGSSILLGGPTQDRGLTVSATGTVTNTGLETITGVDAELLSTLGSSALSSAYDPYSVTVSDTTLTPGESATITVNAYVPEDFDAGEMTIGRVHVYGTPTSGGSADDYTNLNMQARSYLSIDDVEIEIDGDDQGVNLNDVIDDDVVEGSDITLRVTLENLYSSSTDIKDAYFELEDENWDIDETSSEHDIDYNDDEEFTVSFTLDDDLTDDSSEFTIRAYGEDGDEGFDHYDEFTFTIEIEREDDDVRIMVAELDDDTISTNVRSAELEVEIENKGTDDQEDLEITVECISSGLTYHEDIDNIDLDEGESTTEDFNIDIPYGTPAGTYTFRVTVENDNTEDTETVTLTITSSTTTTTTTTTGTTGTSGGSTVVTTPGTTTGTTGSTAIANPVYGQSASSFGKFSDSDTYLILLLGLAILVLFATLFLLIALNKKDKKKKRRSRAQSQHPASARRQTIQIK